MALQKRINRPTFALSRIWQKARQTAYARRYNIFLLNDKIIKTKII
jgi:hypothetical protein